MTGVDCDHVEIVETLQSFGDFNPGTPVPTTASQVPLFSGRNDNRNV